MRLILASQSLLRKRAFDILGLKCETIPSNFDESLIKDENPHQRTKKLAEAKALTVGSKHPDSIVVAGDLFAVMDHKVYEKPKDLKEAERMLKAFSGKEHEVISGIAVYNSKTKKMLSTSKTCKVKFRVINSFEIKDYISRYPVLRFAAAFDGDGLLRFAERIDGSYNFATGLPMPELILFLRQNGVKV